MSLPNARLFWMPAEEQQRSLVTCEQIEPKKDFNAKLVYKACLNHSFFLLLEKETRTSLWKFIVWKGLILFINIHKKSWNNKLLLSIFDKAYFEQDSALVETK